MKPQILAITAAVTMACTAHANAQSNSAPEGLMYQSGANSVTLYGLLDMTLSHQSNANTAGKSLTTMQEPWFSGSRWGLRGQRNLGANGLKAIFKLESEFLLSNGAESNGGILFNRDAWVGLQSDSLGKLTFGRQNTLARDFGGIYSDAYGKMQMDLEEGGYTNTNNFKHLVFYAGSATGTRYDRGIVWKKNFDKFVVGVGYQMGATAGNNDNNTTKSAGVAYNGNGFTVAGFANSAIVADMKHESSSLGGSVQVNPLVRLNAGYYSYKAQQKSGLGNREDKASTVSALFTPGGKFDYALGYVQLNPKNAALSTAGYLLNPYADTSGTGTTLVANGKRATTYASVVYHMDKSTDFYAVVDSVKLTDGYKDKGANGLASQNTFGVGMRLKF